MSSEDQGVTSSGPGAYIYLPLASRYEAIADECMALAAVFRARLADTMTDKSFHADQHRRCLLRAARFARLAEKVRSSASPDTDSHPGAE